MTRAIDISPEHRAIVCAILRAHVAGRKVVAFGSRARGGAKKSSDLDLCIAGEEALPSCTLSTLDEAFDESLLPFKVDVVEWATLDEGFREIVKKDAIELA